MPEPTLTPREMRFVRALLRHAMGEIAAKEAGISLRTARRYHRRPHVRAALAREVAVELRATTTALARFATRAVEALGQAACGDIPATAARVRAAVAVVELSLRAVEVEDHAGRIELLEKAAALARPGRTYQ